MEFNAHPSLLSLELSKSISTFTKEQLIRYKPTARKTHNCRLFMKCASDKKEYQISALNCEGEAHIPHSYLIFPL